MPDGLVHREISKAGRVIIKDAVKVGNQVKEGANSFAYLYPLKGIYYLSTHPDMLSAVKPAIIKSLTVSAIVVVGMFFFTYLPQVFLLAFVSGPLAFLAAIPAVLAESYVLINFIAKTFIFSTISTKLFDAVLLERGHEELCAKGRSFRTSGAGNGAVTLGRTLINPVSSRFTTEGLLRYILSIPLNAIPAIGTILFVVLNAEIAGPVAHSRYFQLKGIKGKERSDFISLNHGAYTAFGIMTIILGLIPFAGPAFTLSSAVGAALWASDMENEGKKVKDVAATGIKVKMGDEL